MNPGEQPVGLEVELFREDFCAATEQIVLNSPMFLFIYAAQRRQAARQVWLIGLCVFALGLLALLAGAPGLALPGLAFGLATPLLAMLIVQLISQDRIARTSARLLERAIEARQSSWRSGAWTFEADAKGATWSNGKRTVRAAWGVVVAIVKTPTHVLVLDADAAVMILPVRCFDAPEDAEALTHAMGALVEVARAESAAAA